MNIYDFIKNFDSFLKECRANKLSKMRIEKNNIKRRIFKEIQSKKNYIISLISIQLIKKIEDNNFLVINFECAKFLSKEFDVYAYLVNGTSKNQKEFIEIPQEFLNEIKRNKDFIDTLKERISSDFKKQQNYNENILNNFLKNIEYSFYNNMNAIRNNRLYQKQQNKNEKAENKKQIENFAKSLNIKQKWYIQSDIYRGEYAPATDDDYNGHLDNASFEMVASELCTTKDEVIKLSKAKVGTAITKIDEERRLKSTYVRKQ